MPKLIFTIILSFLYLHITNARPLVRHIRSAEEFDRLIAKHSRSTGLPVIADFYSDGCGPCRMMAPIFKRMAKENEGKAVFVKVDTNQVHQLSSRYSVRSIPTFIAFYNGKQKNQFSGAGEEQLRQMVSNMINQADYENVVLTRENLGSYYEKHDSQKSEEAIDSIHKKCVDMLKQKDLADCVGAAARKLAKDLKRKYKDTPTLIPRFTEEYRAPKESASDTSKKSKEPKSRKESPTPNNNKANLNLATLEELQNELKLRLEAEEEAKVEDEDDDDAEFENGWKKSNFPERVTIIGGGPAGISAAIYAARAGLKPVVVAPPMGGQLQGKGVDVENYPGMIDVTGPAVVATMRSQAADFGAVFEAETVVQVDASKRPFKVITNSSTIETHTIILATGAESNWLGVDGEYEMRGGGVSTCATCDGHFFKDTHILVVGGGDTAMEDALVLARTSKSVTLVHRRDTFRASKVLAQRVMEHPSINIMWNTTVQEIIGESAPNDPDKKLVTGAKLLAKNTQETFIISCSAVFVAIGHTPTTQFMNGVVDFDPNHAGYVLTQHGSTATSTPGIFAAGDVADAVYRQAITSAGSGAAAALDAERYLSEQGLGNEEAEFEAELLREMMDLGRVSDDGYNAYADDNVATRGYKESVKAEL